MARSPRSDGPQDPAEVAALTAIAESVRGTFQTVEDMTQSFVREAIIQGVFPPGQRLNLDVIASTLGVSRMPVRASLRQLEGEGLVRIHAYRGATVSTLGPTEIAEIYDLRILLEGYLLEQSMARMDGGLLDRLADIVRGLESSVDLGARLESRRSFYQALYERAERPRALAEVNHLRGSVGRYLLLQRVDEPHGHAELLDRLRSGDVQAAKRWLVNHLSHVSERLQQVVAEAEEEGAPASAPDGTAGGGLSPRPAIHVPA